MNPIIALSETEVRTEVLETGCSWSVQDSFFYFLCFWLTWRRMTNRLRGERARGGPWLGDCYAKKTGASSIIRFPRAVPVRRSTVLSRPASLRVCVYRSPVVCKFPYQDKETLFRIVWIYRPETCFFSNCSSPPTRCCSYVLPASEAV